ncbi:MAG: S8 family serine peptidase, partial [Ottowia sp.]|nr:S8 family serine peptidase [Ottowia sp.]
MMKKKYSGVVLTTLALSLSLVFQSTTYANVSGEVADVSGRWQNIPFNFQQAKITLGENSQTGTFENHISASEWSSIKRIILADVALLRSEQARANGFASTEWHTHISEEIYKREIFLAQASVVVNGGMTNEPDSLAAQPHDRIRREDTMHASQAALDTADQQEGDEVILAMSIDSQIEEPQLIAPVLNEVILRDMPIDKYKDDAIHIEKDQKIFEAKMHAPLQTRWRKLEAEIATNKRQIVIGNRYILKVQSYLQNDYVSEAEKNEWLGTIEDRKGQIAEMERWLSEKEPQLAQEKAAFEAKQVRLQQHEKTERDTYNPFLSEVLTRRANPSAYQINKPYASELAAYDGRGVTIGIIDHGFQVNHPQFADKKILTFNAYNKTDKVNRFDSDHGLMVASVAAGSLSLLNPVEFDDNQELRRRKYGTVSLMSETEGKKYLEGVAPGARLAFVDPHGGSDNWNMTASINWLVNIVKAPIINLSADMRADWRDAEGALKEAIAKDTLLIASAGNKGYYELLWPGAYAKEAWANGQIVMVGSVDENNKISKFSNTPGEELAAYFVVVPGENIMVAGSASSYTRVSGTSVAAPQVAAQAALIKDRWPYLKADAIAQIIFKTAQPLGEAPAGSPDPIYGWGLIDIRKSLLPVGELTMQMSDGQRINVNQVDLGLGRLSGALAASLLQVARQGELRIAATDSFQRDFSVDLGDGAKIRPSSNVSQLLGDQTRQPIGNKISLDARGSYVSYAGHALALPPEQRGILGYHANQDTTVLNQISVMKRFANQSELMASVGSAHPYFSLASHGVAGTSELTGAAFTDAYLTLMPMASSVGLGQQWSQGFKVKFGFASTRFSSVLLRQQQPNMTLQNYSLAEEKVETNLARVEISQRF